GAMKMPMSRTRVLVGIGAAALITGGVLALRGGSSFGRGPTSTVAAAPVAAPGPAAREARGSPGLAPAAPGREPGKVAAAELAKLAGDIQVVGTVAFHEDHFAVVGPLVPGRISRVSAGVGDKVKRGQVIAEIESSEVGQARAELVSAKARFTAADAN